MEKSTFSAVDFDVLLGCCVLCFPHSNSMTRQKAFDVPARFDFMRNILVLIAVICATFVHFFIHLFRKKQTKKRKEVKKRVQSPRVDGRKVYNFHDDDLFWCLLMIQ